MHRRQVADSRQQLDRTPEVRLGQPEILVVAPVSQSAADGVVTPGQHGTELVYRVGAHHRSRRVLRRDGHQHASAVGVEGTRPSCRDSEFPMNPTQGSAFAVRHRAAPELLTPQPRFLQQDEDDLRRRGGTVAAVHRIDTQTVTGMGPTR
jgi:hypothetical protein